MLTLDTERESRRSLQRLFPRVENSLADSIASDPQGWREFSEQLEKYFTSLFSLYLSLYGARYDFFFHLEDLLLSLARSWFARPNDLRDLDSAREGNPLWYQSNQMLGGVCYVDLFAGNLGGVRSRIPYFKELGLTYLHLMPLFKAPEGENDGGDAISSYRDVHPPLGTMDQLASLARDFREAGISLVVDLVFNHTSDEHIWAEAAKAGDCRISGTCASLAGLEKAINDEGPNEIELAIRRILLIHGAILTAGGIPLIYLGDDIGTINDYTYQDDPAHERDSRWVHRPRAAWEQYAKRNDPTCIEGQVYQGLQRLIALRKEHDAFSGGELEIIPTQNEHVLSFIRTHAGESAVIFANFFEQPQVLSAQMLKQYSIDNKKLLHGLSQVSPGTDLVMAPLDFMVFGN